MTCNKRVSSTSLWSNLPQEITSKIETRLDSAIDMSQLRSVCKNWRASRNPDNISILCPFLPRTIPNANLPFTDRLNAPVTLVARAVFLVKPLRSPSNSCGWLLTVEEIMPGKLRILYPLSKDRVKNIPSNCPKSLDLSKFNVSQVAKSYGFKYESDGEDVTGVRRVVVCDGYIAMVLFGEGTLIGLRLKSGNWSYFRHSILSSFSDVITFSGNNVRAIDYNGNVYVIDHRAPKVIKTISPKSVFQNSDRIILLASNEELVATACVSESGSNNSFDFVIYSLDQVKGVWVTSSRRDCCTKALFISSDWSFFLYTRDLDIRHHSPKPIPTISFHMGRYKNNMSGDYVIYREDSFKYSTTHRSNNPSTSLYKGTSLDLPIYVFFFNRNDKLFWEEQHCSSSTSDVLWPPPTWFWPDTYSSSREDEELDIHNHKPSPFNKNTLPPIYATDTSTKAITEKKQGLKFIAAEKTLAMTIQNLNQNSSTVLFKGININSNLVPTLEKIWQKYGHITEGSTIRNADIIARALESLATSVIILQSSSGRSLNKDQADYLSSTLCDLQQMKFKVDWLVAFVEKASAVQKSKPLIDSLKDFRKLKAQAEEMKLKILDELAKLDEHEEDLVLVSERLPVLESMDFDQSLGDGLC